MPWPDLGEYEGERTWYNGAAPDPFPLAIQIGEPWCISNGEREPAPTDRTYVNGFDRRCYGFELPTVPPLIPRLDVNQRRTMSQLADIQAILYNDPAAAALLLQQLLGVGSVVSFVADSPTSPYSGSLIGISDTQQVVMSSGTTNQQQWAAQLLYGSAGPQSFGLYSTNAQWWANANTLITRMLAAGYDPAKPTTYVGHSYGGATVQVIAAQQLLFRPDADIQILTFGSPRAGDTRLYGIIDKVPQVHIAAVGDPLTAIPPVGLELLPFALLAPAPLYAQWSTIGRPREVMNLDDLGNLTPGNPSLFNYANIYNAVLAAIAVNPLPIYSAHLMGYYADKLKELP